MSDNISQQDSGPTSATSIKESFNCNAIFDQEEVPLVGKVWKRAKQCILEVDDGGFHFNDTTIAHERLKRVSLRVFDSGFFIRCCVVTLQGDDFCHHFAMKYSDFWEKDLLPIQVEKVKEETPFLMVRKALIVLIVFYIVYELLK